MAIRVTQKLLRQLARPLSSTTTPSISAADAVSALDFSHPTTTTPLPSSSIPNFDDAQTLFSSFPTSKLIQSTFNLHALAMDPVVDFGIWVMRSRLMNTPVVRDLILSTVKHTFYEQFVAGKDLDEMGRTVERIWSSGLKGMIVYGVEHAHDNESCDRNFARFKDTAESALALPPSSVSFVIVKVSAILPIELLERVSNLLRWERKDPSFNLPWKQTTLPVFGDSSPLFHTLQKPDPLTPEEERDLQLGHQRLLKLCRRCAELNVPLTVDAEETTVEPAINYLTYSSAIALSKEGGSGSTSRSSPVVYGTIQAYLKDSMERLVGASKAAEEMGVPIGFKLVRGAYMSFERKLAASLGFDSPVHDSIQGTHDSYNACASYLIDKVSGGSGALVLATHNVESGRLAATRARDMGIRKENERVQFAQLYGMSDTLSYGLKNAGFQVSKYLTYGPLEEVIPYLLRRAEENRGVLSSSTLDRQLMRKELTRRLNAGLLG